MRKKEATSLSLFILIIIIIISIIIWKFYLRINNCEKISASEVLKWEDVNYPTFFAPVSDFIFCYNNWENNKLKVIKTSDSKEIAYNNKFSYPLRNLWKDFSVSSIKWFLDNWYEIEIDKINNYQFPNSTWNIINFLYSLSHNRIDEAIAVLKKDFTVIPFIFHWLDFISIENWWDRIIWKWLYYDLTDPMEIKYEIFVSWDVLYFVFE